MQAGTKTVTTPQIKWAQRKDKLFVTIDVVEVKNPQIDIVDGRLLKFQGSDSNHAYGFEIELYDEVLKEESKFSLDSRNIFLNIKKKTKSTYWPRLQKESGKLNWVGIDWKYYIDEDDEDEDSAGPNFGNEQSKKNFKI
jgi:prostaglandin-E synthase